MGVPVTSLRNRVTFDGGQRWDRFQIQDNSVDLERERPRSGSGRDARAPSKQDELLVAARADWQLDTALAASGDGPIGRGARGPIPLHIIYQAHNLKLMPGKKAHWRLTLRLEH
jgi:hypothetical protein